MQDFNNFLKDGWYEIEEGKDHKWVWSKKKCSLEFKENNEGYLLEFFSEKNNLILNFFMLVLFYSTLKLSLTYKSIQNS